MSEKATVPSRTSGEPIEAIRAEVIAGADQGQAAQATGETLTVGTAPGNDLVLTDPTVSRYHVELTRRGDRILVRDLASTNGTLVGAARLEGQAVTVPTGTVLELGRTTLRLGDGATVVLELQPVGALGQLVGRTVVMRRLLATLQRLAGTDAPVMIIGESGTGKELAARALHECGARAAGPFVTVDCGAVAPTLFASELFGHERGSFTGADRRHQGAFERARGGTLFLDEVAELPAELQAALLGVLERRRFRRVGGSEELSVDVRVVCATNRDLRAEVNAGSFRLDLYYRLAVVRVQLPPLRERTADIPLLVEIFLREAGYEGTRAEVFSDPALAELQAHRWPGNIRELRNLVEATLAVGQEARPESLEGPPFAAPGDVPDLIGRVLGLNYREARAAVLTEFERRYLADLLRRTEGTVRRAAREARMDRSHLIELLRRHGLG